MHCGWLMLGQSTVRKTIDLRTLHCGRRRTHHAARRHTFQGQNLLRLLARVVVGINVGDTKRTIAADLYDSLALGPGEVAHTSRGDGEATGLQLHGLAGIELVTHTKVEAAGDDGGGFLDRMEMRGDFVA